MEQIAMYTNTLVVPNSGATRNTSSSVAVNAIATYNRKPAPQHPRN